MSTLKSTAIVELTELVFHRGIKENGIAFMEKHFEHDSEEMIRAQIDNFKLYRKVVERVFDSPNTTLTEDEIFFVYHNVKCYVPLTMENYKKLEKQYRCRYPQRNEYFKRLLCGDFYFDGFNDARFWSQVAAADQ